MGGRLTAAIDWSSVVPPICLCSIPPSSSGMRHCNALSESHFLLDEYFQTENTHQNVMTWKLHCPSKKTGSEDLAFGCYCITVISILEMPWASPSEI
jgi:hypothetical protein